MTDENSIRTRLDFIGIDSATRKALQELKPLITRALPGILDQFYAKVVKYPAVAKLFPNDGVIRHAKQAQIAHWIAIASGTFDDGYVKSVTRIGQTHNRLGLEPRWYIAGYSMILTGLQQAIEMETAQGWFNGSASREKKVALQAALTRAAMLDMDFAISVYLDAAKLDQQTAMRKIADDFESAVGDIVNTVSSASAQLETSAGKLTKTAEMTEQLSTGGATASDQVSA